MIPRCSVAMLTIAILTHARHASAETWIIKEPAPHPDRTLAIEPHGVVAIDGVNWHGLGVGGRFSFTILETGFLPSINDSVGFGVGADWAFFNETCIAKAKPRSCEGGGTLWIPSVMQWNFHLTESWTAFAEPGLALRYDEDDKRNDLILRPAFYLGGHYFFGKSTAVTLRLGWPTVSLGVTFFP